MADYLNGSQASTSTNTQLQSATSEIHPQVHETIQRSGRNSLKYVIIVFAIIIIGALAYMQFGIPTTRTHSMTTPTTTIINATPNNIIIGVISGFDGPSDVVFSPNGTRAYVSVYGGLDIIDTATNTILINDSSIARIQELDGTVPYTVLGGIDGVAFSSNAAYPMFAYGFSYESGNSTVNSLIIEPIDTITGPCKYNVDPFCSTSTTLFYKPIKIAFSHDGRYVYVTSLYDWVGVYDTLNAANIKYLIGFNESLGIAVAPNGSYMYVTNYGNKTISIVNTSTGNITGTINGINYPDSVAFSPDGKYAYVTTNGQNNTVRIIDTNTSTIIGTISGFNAAFGIAVAPSGSYAYVVDPFKGTINILRLGSVQNYSSAENKPVVATTTITSNSSQPQTPTCGPRNTCMSKMEMAALVNGSEGADTVYNTAYSQNYTQLSYATNVIIDESVLANNVTAVWVGQYANNQYVATSSADLEEMVFQMPSAQSFYNVITRHMRSGSTELMYGITYTYLANNSSIGSNFAVVGYKGNKVFIVTTMNATETINVNALITILSNDIT